MPLNPLWHGGSPIPNDHYGDEEGVYMRWLHISDLHIDTPYTNSGESQKFLQSFLHGSSAISGQNDLQNGGLEYQVEKEQVDFIIFTGDLFNHGKWSKGQKEAALEFLEEIYEICSEKSAKGKISSQ